MRRRSIRRSATAGVSTSGSAMSLTAMKNGAPDATYTGGSYTSATASFSR